MEDIGGLELLINSTTPGAANNDLKLASRLVENSRQGSRAASLSGSRNGSSPGSLIDSPRPRSVVESLASMGGADSDVPDGDSDIVSIDGNPPPRNRVLNRVPPRSFERQRVPQSPSVSSSASSRGRISVHATPVKESYNDYLDDDMDEESRKRELLYQFHVMEREGTLLPAKYTLDSPLKDMELMYDRVIREREESSSIEWQKSMLITACTGIELLNDTVNPWKLHLNGWSNQVNDQAHKWNDIFRQIHVKHGNKIGGKKIPPEIKLLFAIVVSAFSFHMTQSLSAAIMNASPDVSNVLNSDPELKRRYEQQATKLGAQNMASNNGGLLGKMMGGVMGMFGGSQPTAMKPPVRPMPPPPGAPAPPMHRPGQPIPGAQPPAPSNEQVRSVISGIKERLNARSVLSDDSSLDDGDLEHLLNSVDDGASDAVTTMSVIEKRNGKKTLVL